MSRPIRPQKHPLDDPVETRLIKNFKKNALEKAMELKELISQVQQGYKPADSTRYNEQRIDVMIDEIKQSHWMDMEGLQQKMLRLQQSFEVWNEFRGKRGTCKARVVLLKQLQTVIHVVEETSAVPVYSNKTWIADSIKVIEKKIKLLEEKNHFKKVPFIGLDRNYYLIKIPWVLSIWNGALDNLKRLACRDYINHARDFKELNEYGLVKDMEKVVIDTYHDISRVSTKVKLDKLVELEEFKSTENFKDKLIRWVLRHDFEMDKDDGNVNSIIRFIVNTLHSNSLSIRRLKEREEVMEIINNFTGKWVWELNSILHEYMREDVVRDLHDTVKDLTWLSVIPYGENYKLSVPLYFSIEAQFIHVPVNGIYSGSHLGLSSDVPERYMRIAMTKWCLGEGRHPPAYLDLQTTAFDKFSKWLGSESGHIYFTRWSSDIDIDKVDVRTVAQQCFTAYEQHNRWKDGIDTCPEEYRDEGCKEMNRRALQTHHLNQLDVIPKRLNTLISKYTPTSPIYFDDESTFIKDGVEYKEPDGHFNVMEDVIIIVKVDFIYGKLLRIPMMCARTMLGGTDRDEYLLRGI